MLIQGRALKKGAQRGAGQDAFPAWFLRSALTVLTAGLTASLVLAVLTWVALWVGGGAAARALTGSQAALGAAPLRELLAGWTVAYFSSQLTPVALASASPPGLGFGLGSPLVLAAGLAAAFRAGVTLEETTYSRPGLIARAAALALPQLLASVLLFSASRAGAGPLAGAPPAGLLPLPAILTGLASVGGALWRQERRLGGPAVAGARGIAVAILSLLLAAGGTAVFTAAALAAALASGRLKVPGGFGTALLGLVYLPNLAFLSVSAGLGGGPPLATSVEPVLCALVVAGCLAGALHLSDRPDRVERAFFIAGFPLLVLLAAVDARPLVSNRTLDFTPGVAFWVALVVAAVAAVAGPRLAGHAVGRLFLSPAPLAGLRGRLPDPVLDGSVTRRLRRVPAVRRGEAGALGTAVLLITGVTMLAMILLVGLVPTDEPGGPEDAARAYLQAEAAGSAPAQWSHLFIDRSRLPSGASAVLLSEAGLEAMRRLEQNRPTRASSVRVLSTRGSGAGALVGVAYTAAGSAVSRELTLVKEGGAWKVRLEPALLVAGGIPAGAGLSVDGVPVPAALPVAVLPGYHSVGTTGTSLWQPGTAIVEASSIAPAATPVSVRPALSNAALGAAIRAVQAAFAACAGSSSPAPSGCPLSVSAPPGSAVGWQLAGDPAAGAIYTPVDGSSVTALGHYQAIGSFAVHLPEGVRHLPSSGGFRLPLRWDGSAFTAGRAAADSAVPPAVRPDLPDSAVLGAVGAGFQACLASDKLRPADCPQSVPSSLFITGVRWTRLGDPLAGAVVSFDGAAAVLHVTGSFSMAVSYQAGGRTASATSAGRYRADLFWDGGRPILVQIEAA